MALSVNAKILPKGMSSRQEPAKGGPQRCLLS